jgi:hypothetical protein
LGKIYKKLPKWTLYGPKCFGRRDSNSNTTAAAPRRSLLDLAELLELARDYSFISIPSISPLPDLSVEYVHDLAISLV